MGHDLRLRISIKRARREGKWIEVVSIEDHPEDDQAIGRGLGRPKNRGYCRSSLTVCGNRLRQADPIAYESNALMKRLSDYESALVEMARKNPDVTKVSGLLSTALGNGDYRAAYALGTWYLHGRYFKRNMKKAFHYLRLAAKYDVPDALYDLAVCYEKGAGTAVNLKKSAQLYLRAALLGEKQSVYEVGRCYYWGIGVAKDRLIARVWLDYAHRLGIGSCKERNE